MGYNTKLIDTSMTTMQRRLCSTAPVTSGNNNILYAPLLKVPLYNAGANPIIVSDSNNYLFRVICYDRYGNFDSILVSIISNSDNTKWRIERKSNLFQLKLDNDGINLILYGNAYNYYSYIEVFLIRSLGAGYIIPLSYRPFTVSSFINSQDSILTYNVLPTDKSNSITLGTNLSTTANFQTFITVHGDNLVNVIFDVTSSVALTSGTTLGTVPNNIKPSVNVSFPVAFTPGGTIQSGYGFLYNNGSIQLFGVLNATRVMANFSYTL
ncbi:MAG: hypothetical protein K0R54_5403 [Clostridiaceae bacterium]|jgi:hypothetical protein|nr:hypothetical protein [Clostridiaceae bacterium]